MAKWKATNNARSVLVNDITASDDTFEVAAGELFPEDMFIVSIGDEILEVGLRTGNVFSDVVRGMEGTVATNHSANSIISCRLTAGMYEELLSKSELGDQKGEPGGVASLDATGNVPLEQLGNVPDPDLSGYATKTEFDTHTADTANPHAVTKTQIGLGNVTNNEQATKIELDAHKAEKATETKLGHVKAKTKEDGTLIIPINIPDGNMYNAVLVTKDVTKIIATSDSYGGTIRAIAIDDAYVYVGGGITQTVQKLNKTNLAQVAESASYEDIYAIAVDDTYVYVGGGITQTVQKLNKTNLSRVAESAGYGGHIWAIAVDDTYVYVGGGITQTVQKLNKTNLSRVAESAGYGGHIRAIAVDDTYVYVGGETTRTVQKLNKSDLSLVAESAGYGGSIIAIAVDDTYVYVGGETTRTVQKLNKTNLSRVAESAGYGGTIWAIAVDDTYVYVGGATTRTVQKLNKTNLSRVAESAGYGGTIWAIAVDDTYVYVGGETAQIVQRLGGIHIKELIRVV